MLGLLYFGAASELRLRFRASKTGPVVFLLIDPRRFFCCSFFFFFFLFFFCASVVSYLVFVLSLFIPHLSFFWYLRMAVLRDCGISWVIAPAIQHTSSIW